MQNWISTTLIASLQLTLSNLPSKTQMHLQAGYQPESWHTQGNELLDLHIYCHILLVGTSLCCFLRDCSLCMQPNSSSAEDSFTCPGSSSTNCRTVHVHCCRLSQHYFVCLNATLHVLHLTTCIPASKTGSMAHKNTAVAGKTQSHGGQEMPHACNVKASETGRVIPA